MNLNWMDLARCKDHPTPDLFFPSEAGMASRRQAQEAARVCAVCPVSAQCQEHKRRTGATSGVWAGGMHRPRKPRQPKVVHGTDGGYHAHLKRKEAACDSCRSAHMYANQKWARR